MISLAHFDAPAGSVLVQARRHALHGRRRTIGSRDLMAGLIDRADIVELLARLGFSLSALTDQLGAAPPAADHLLSGLGIDPATVRAAAGAPRPGLLEPWRLRRCPARPLRITLEGPSSTIAFDRSGRKVLEVAVWASRRSRRTASPLDLLRGVCADGADPVAATLMDAGPGPCRRLQLELDRLDQPHG